MKKLLALILATLMLLSLVACDSETPPNNNNDPMQNESNNQENGNNTSDDTNDNNKTGDSETNPDDEGNEENDISFTGLVAVDNEECMIKVTEIDPDNIWGYTLKVQLENKSDDKTYMFSVESAAINGVQCDPFFATEVAANKKANKEIIFAGNELKENGVKDYTDIELSFRVYDSNDWTAEAVAKATIHVYPYGESKAAKYERVPQESDTIIIDNEYVTVIVTGYEDDSIWGYTANLFLLNKTEKNVMFSVDDASINGYMADPFFAKSVSAGKCAFGSMSWSDTMLEENGIVAVEEIEFNMRAYNEDNWLADDFANEVITLNP